MHASIWLLASVFILLSACKSTTKSGGDSFRVNLGTEPPSLDWSLATDHVSFNVISNLMVGLTEFDKELKPAPVIAKYTGVLAAADVFTPSTAFQVMQSIRLDLGYASQVHP